MNVALYARVNNDGQDPEVQLMALRAHAVNRCWTITGEFIDQGYSGAKEKRPALDQLMNTAWSGSVQAVLVWRFDRFARSVKHLITALEQFRSLNVNFISFQEQFDTSTPIGQAMFTIIAVMAQLERDIIRERVRAGLAVAKARGKRLGRPSVRVNQQELRSLQTSGLSLHEMARQLHCSRSTVRRRLKGVQHETRGD